MAQAFDQKFLFMPGPSAALVEYRQIRRIEKQQMERLMADAAVEETAKTNAVQARLRLLRPALVQLHAVSVAVVPLGELPEGLAAAAAWVKQVGGDALREPDTPQDKGNIVRIGGIAAHLHIVHQPPNDGGVGLALHWELPGKIPQHIIDGAVGVAHEAIVTTVEKRYKGHHQRKRQREGFFSKSASSKPRNVR